MVDDNLTDEEREWVRLLAPTDSVTGGVVTKLAARLSEARRELDGVRADLYRASDGLWDEFVEVRAARDAVVRERDEARGHIKQNALVLEELETVRNQREGYGHTHIGESE